MKEKNKSHKIMIREYSPYKIMIVGLIFFMVQTLFFPNYQFSFTDTLYWILGLTGAGFIYLGLYVILRQNGNIYFEKKKMKFRLKVNQ